MNHVIHITRFTIVTHFEITGSYCIIRIKENILIMNQEEMRYCVVCKKTKPIDEFGSSGKYIRRQCKVCFYDARRRDRSKLVGQRGRHRFVGIERKCSRCGITKPVSEFSKNGDRVLARCKKCIYEVRRESAIKAGTLGVVNKKRFRGSAKFLYFYLVDHPCVDCGETDVVLLEFDHVNGDKDKSISQMRLASLVTIQKEIEKCEVRCRNCHKKRHSIENNTLFWQLTKNDGLFDDELPD